MADLRLVGVVALAFALIALVAWGVRAWWRLILRLEQKRDMDAAMERQAYERARAEMQQRTRNWRLSEQRRKAIEATAARGRSGGAA